MLVNCNFKDPPSAGDVQKSVKLHKHNMHALSFRKAEFGMRARVLKREREREMQSKTTTIMQWNNGRYRGSQFSG